MRNKFFDIALEQAARLGGGRRRMLLLLTKLGVKMKDVNWASIGSHAIKEKFFVLARMARAYASGRYRDIPWKSMLIVLAAIIYFINPLDLIPDMIPVMGLTDDFAIMVWVYNNIQAEIKKFLIWEETQAAMS